MEPILHPKKIVEHYFQTWKEYNIRGVMQLFDAKAKYKIRPKQKTLNGHAEICEYWRRNKQRQKGIELLWDILSVKKSYAKVHFVAKFYDKEENEHQKVVGIIELYLNEQQNTVILLSESYQKSILGGKNGFISGID